MSDLRSKLAKTTAAAPIVRTAQTFTGGTADAAAATPAAGRNNARTTVYLAPELRRQLKVAAAERDTTMNDIITAAIQQWFVNNPHLNT